MQNHTTRREFLGAATAAIIAARATGQGRVSDAEERQKIEAAIPARAYATPRKSRKLLIFDFNVNYGGHRSAKTANVAFTLMGQRTGAFETVVSNDPAVFAPAGLGQFDAVFFNNNVGNLFEDASLRQSLVEFVYSGGGMMGVHGTSVAFTKWPGAIEDWPEFGIMLGARGANHRASDEHVFIKLDDPTHPVTQMFSNQGFDYRDEFFRVHEPYSRNRVRVLLSIDTEKTDMNQGPSYGKIERADNDYALAWVRQYGRGRVFYCGFAHNPYVFWDPKMLQFYLAATQFILGDLPGPTTPSARLTPAIRAQERLGWRLGLVPSLLPKPTLFETIDAAGALGLLYVGGRSGQKVSGDIPKDFDEQLSPEEMRQIRLKLDSAGVRLLTYRADRMPSDEDGWRRVLAFARKMGVEALDIQSRTQLPSFPPSTSGAASDQPVVSLGSAPSFSGRGLQVLEQLCDGHGILLARDNLSGKAISRPEDILIDEQIVQLDALGGNKESVSYLLGRMHKDGFKPTMFSVEFGSDKSVQTGAMAQTIEAFNQAVVPLADGGRS
jgi:type 1 glutamine amidotransferase